MGKNEWRKRQLKSGQPILVPSTKMRKKQSEINCLGLITFLCGDLLQMGGKSVSKMIFAVPFVATTRIDTLNTLLLINFLLSIEWPESVKRP